MMVSDYPGLSGDGATIHAHRRPYLGKQARVPVHRLEGILDRAGITHVNYSMHGAAAAVPPCPAHHAHPLQRLSRLQ
jgi:hypothetical protein